MRFDIVIIGSGLAGLSVALHLAENHKVAVISKRALLDGASNWAQGGIAAVLDSGDSHQQHIDDTLLAGAGLFARSFSQLVGAQTRKKKNWLLPPHQFRLQLNSSQRPSLPTMMTTYQFSQ